MLPCPTTQALPNMDDNIQSVLDHTLEGMSKAIKHLEKELLKIRTGKASPDMLDHVFVDYYGTQTPLNQVGNVGLSDTRTLVVTPWEKKMIPVIEKAIRDANLGLNPSSDSEKVIVPVPALNEERRKELVKQAKQEAELARVSIRTHRKDGNDHLKKLQKDGTSEDLVRDAETEVQSLTDKYNEQIENMISEKEEQIMTV